MNDWYEFVVRTAGTDNQTQIQLRTGVPQSTIAKWKKGNQPSPAQVQKLAAALDVNVLEAFIYAGFLTAEQAGAAPALIDLAEVSGDLLAEEVTRRLGTRRRNDHLAAQEGDWRLRDPARRPSTILRFTRWLTGEDEEGSLREQRREFEEAAQHVQAGMLSEEEVVGLLKERAEELERRADDYERLLDEQIAQHADDSAEDLLAALRAHEIDFNAFKSITMARYFSNHGLYGQLVDLVLEGGGRTVAVDAPSQRYTADPDEAHVHIVGEDDPVTNAMRGARVIGVDDPGTDQGDESSR